MRLGLSVTLVLALLSAAAAPAYSASAEAGTVVVALAGEGFDGPPQFLVKFNGSAIGDGAVDTAVDTPTAGPLSNVGDIAPYVRTFEFTVPADVFTTDGDVSIELTNDAFDTDTGFDRNLMIYSLEVNGLPVPSADYRLTKDGVDIPVQYFRTHIAVYSGGTAAVALAPASGWPRLESTDPVVPVAENPPPATPAPPVIAEAPPPPPPPQCEERSVVVTDFGRGLLNVPDSQAPALSALASALTPGLCRVTVTGYASVGGKPEVNRNMAQARAEAVLGYLKKQGGVFSGELVVPFGETEQFGTAAVDNQRVVVELAP